MKRSSVLFSILIIITGITVCFASVSFSDDMIEQIKINNSDIPSGFMLGKIPQFASKVFTGNPCYVDDRGKRIIADKIYPGGNAVNIKTMHVTILASSRTPYGDDIVCYILVFKDPDAAKKEIKKLQEYTGYNGDRSLLIVKDTMAVFIHADDTAHFNYIESIGSAIQSRMQPVDQ